MMSALLGIVSRAFSQNRSLSSIAIDMNKARSDDQIRIEQIRSIYRTSAPGVLTTLVSVFVLTVGLIHIDAATRPRASIFLSIMFVQSIARLLLYRAYLRAGSGQ